MCGIAGFAGAGSVEDLRRMAARMRLRGPDAQTTWFNESPRVGLAHTRLSVLDHAGGAQPMWTPDGALGIVFNGEIYNFAALRRELQALGCRFASDHSDTEVLLHAYRAWGPGMATRLNGMWAFVIVDLRAGQLFASRDRFGKKPLYYRHDGRNLVFASQADALRCHPGALTPLDTLSIKKYLCYGYLPAPRSLWQGVCKLPAGCQCIFDLASGRLDVSRYWRYQLEPQQATGDSASDLRRLLEEAVARRLVADVPVGTFLSGGIDSSVVSALAARRHGSRLMTFSIGFDEAGFDESAHARAVARHIGSEHIAQQLRLEDALQMVDGVLGQLDEPCADSSILPTALVSQIARQHVTVALGGDGADELFAGYAPFKALRWARLLGAAMPRPALALARKMVDALPVNHSYMSLDFKLKRGLAGVAVPPSMRIPAWMAPVSADEVNDLVRDGTVHTREEIYSEAIEAWNQAAALGQEEGALQVFTDLYLQDDILAKVDRASMQHSLEVRAPFLDIHVADFARRLPMGHKLRGGTTKWLLRQAARGLVPREVIERPKQGFAVPVGRWFAQGRLAVDPAALPECFDRQQVAALSAQHRAGRRDQRLALWALLSLSRSASGPA